jgi:hypothetical protein
VGLSFVSTCTLCSHIFAFCHHSYYFRNCNHLPPTYYCYFFFHFILVSPMHFQPPLCISSDDTHHTMIGTFLLYAPVFSNIQNSDRSYSGLCLCFFCFSIPSDSRQCFGSGMLPIQIF